MTFSNAVQRRILALAKAIVPKGSLLPEPDAAFLARLEALLLEIGPDALAGYPALVRATNLASIPICGRPLTRLSLTERKAVVLELNEEKTFFLMRLVSGPMKAAQARSPELLKAHLVNSEKSLPIQDEKQRWHAQVIDAAKLRDDEDLTVDAVVIGTGAGGSPVAHALAAQGYAVLMLEEGAYYKRSDFTQSPVVMQQKLYQKRGLTYSLGNTIIPIPLGKSVGGTTTINSGTCYRAPNDTLKRWQVEHGLKSFTSKKLHPYYLRAERMMQAQPNSLKILGGVAKKVAKGCENLGYAHEPLRRNAPECDGQGVCCFGCPTDAKRSTNVSYVPEALKKGAMLYTNARVEKVLMQDGKAVGVQAFSLGSDGKRRKIRVHATAVVLAAGTLGSATLLLKQKLANTSGQVGKNLTIHPATYQYAQFDDDIHGWNAVPQGYGVDEFAELGIRLEGVFLPPTLAAMAMGQVGARWTKQMERFDKTASFGFMIADSSRGQITLDKKGEARISYWLNKKDQKKLITGHAILARIFQAAGAKSITPGLQVFDDLTLPSSVEKLEREGPKTLHAHQFDVSAFHPLGTCRMGSDARTSVVGPDHQCHDVKGLFICDGSAISGPLGVNPQLTIMAFSERASEYIMRFIDKNTPALADEASSVSFDSFAKAQKKNKKESPMPFVRKLHFLETMAGTLKFKNSIQEEKTARFSVAATEENEQKLSVRTLHLQGKITLEGCATQQKTHGTLTLSPLKRQNTIVYHLYFNDDHGVEHHLIGTKHTPSLISIAKGMTTLHTQLFQEKNLVAEGILRFDLRDLGLWLRSFKLKKIA